MKRFFYGVALLLVVAATVRVIVDKVPLPIKPVPGRASPVDIAKIPPPVKSIPDRAPPENRVNKIPSLVQPIPNGVYADYVLVEKSRRTLTLFANKKPIRSYLIALGRNPVGPKMRQNDMRTPEGFYHIDRRNPHSQFHLSLHINYPSAADIARARAGGYPPGGDVMVHGLPNGLGLMGSRHRLLDWTAGCIAVTNDEIEEIWRVVPDGTPIEIRP
ncbi:MAG: L,D-transpeptidase family protein [Candidatus Competibacteraceae bacterium]